MSLQIPQMFQPLSTLRDSAQFLGAADSENNSSTPRDQFEQNIVNKFEICQKSHKEMELTLQTLVQEFAQMKHNNQQIHNDYMYQVDLRRKYERQLYDLQRSYRSLQAQMSIQPFVFVLIDGDGVIFQDSLLSKGTAGGSEAASELLAQVKNYIQEIYDDAGQYSIMVQIYANFNGLARILKQIGTIDSEEEFTAFAQAFTTNQSLFSFIDVGPGKERADYKIQEVLKLFAENKHCKHILFGGTHNKGYLNILNSYKLNKDVAPRLTLLQSTKAQFGYKDLGLEIISFDPVFRTGSLPSNDSRRSSTYTGVSKSETFEMAQTHAESVPTALHPEAQKNELAVPPKPSTTRLPPITESPVPMAVSEQALSGPPSSTPATALSTDSASSEHGWQIMSKLKASDRGVKVVKVLAQTTGCPTQKRFILQNAKDERVDEKLPKPDGQVASRFLERIHHRGKVCNRYHLLGHCKENGQCQFKHGERLSKDEKIYLTLKVREQVCYNFSQCRDFECLLGHHCSRDPCDRVNCRFEKAGREIDQRVITKVYDDNTVERFF